MFYVYYFYYYRSALSNIMLKFLSYDFSYNRYTEANVTTNTRAEVTKSLVYFRRYLTISFIKGWRLSLDRLPR